MTDIKQVYAPTGVKTERPESVKIATAGFEDAIYDLLTGPGGLYDENALFPMSKPKVLETIKYGCARHNGKLGSPGGPQGMIGLIQHDGKVVGSIGMAFSQFWYTEAWHLSEYWNFVHADHRHTEYASDLIDFGKWCAEQLSIPLHMGIISTHRVKAKVRLYQRKIRYMGGYFMHNLPEDKLQAVGGA